MRPLRRLFAAIAIVGASGVAEAQTTPDHYKPFEFLVGYCWSGAFPDGKATDTHCYEWKFGREFIYDRHTVKSAGPDYKGETTYYLDGATNSVKYRYWNSDGGHSDGTIKAEANVLRIVEDTYRGKDGKVQELQGEIERLSDTQYRARIRAWDGKVWKDASSVDFVRVDAKPQVAASDKQALLEHSVRQLRDARGRWTVTTEFLRPDGTIAKAAIGTYDFEWVVEDRVLNGQSEIPELGIKSGILFYVNEGKGLIEMASVGKDGHLWVMTGPVGGETRATPDTPMSDGSTMKLRFTRYNVSTDRFESRMEVSIDGGSSWTQGNHQVFTRKN